MKTSQEYGQIIADVIVEELDLCDPGNMTEVVIFTSRIAEACSINALSAMASTSCTFRDMTKDPSDAVEFFDGSVERFIDLVRKDAAIARRKLISDSMM